MLIRKNLEFSPRPSVRSSVRQQRVFSESLHYFFSETLQLVRACKGRKNVPSAFLKKMTEINFCVKIFFRYFSLKTLFDDPKSILPFFGVLSGFLGVPQTIYFGGLSLYLDNSLREKLSEVERDPAKQLVV